MKKKLYSSVSAAQWGHRLSELWCSQIGLCPRALHPLSAPSASQRNICTSLRLLTLLSINLIFRDELQWAAEYSEAWQSFGWPVIYELVAESISTFPTPYLICPWSLLMFGHTVVMDSLREGWPGGRVLVLGPTGEQLVITLGANINPWFEVVFKDLSAKETAKRHSCAFGTEG